MQVFKMLDGSVIKSSSFMRGPTLPKGHSWRDTNGIWVEKPYPVESTDQSREEIFGYEQKEFLMKQYR